MNTWQDGNININTVMTLQGIMPGTYEYAVLYIWRIKAVMELMNL